MKKKYFFTLIISIIISFSTTAQWQHTSFPNVNYVNCFFSNSNYIFSGYSNGVYISTNDGINWTSANNGLPLYDVFALVISGNNIFAGTNYGIYLSTNNGLVWSSVYGNGGFQVRSFAINGLNVFAGTNIGVYLTTNNGVNWNITGHSQFIMSLLIVNTNIFCGLFYQPMIGAYGVNKSTDNGVNWFAVNNGIPDSTTVNSLAVCGNNIFAGGSRLNGGGCYKSTNNGASWINTGIPLEGYSYAVTGANIFAGGITSSNTTGLYLSTDTGTTWASISSGLPNTYIRALAVHGQYIFAGTDSFGIWRRPLSDFGITGIGIINENNEKIYIYPNPAKNTLVIENAEKSNLSFYNLSGVIIQKKKCNTVMESLDVSSLPEGVYLIKIVSEKKLITKMVNVIK